MLKALTIAGLALASMTGAASAQGASALGKWMTESGSAQVQIKTCGDRLCGEIVWLKEPLNDQGQPKRDIRNEKEELRGRPLLGLNMLEGFMPAGDPGKWDGGFIYNPEDGKTYKSTMTLESEKTLRVRGYVGVPLFGKTQVWSRVD